MNKKKWCYHLH